MSSNLRNILSIVEIFRSHLNNIMSLLLLFVITKVVSLSFRNFQQSMLIHVTSMVFMSCG